MVRARSPFLFLTATVTLWSIPPFKALFAPGGAMYHWVVNIPVPFLDKLVARMPPVVHEATAYAAVYKFDWFSATGTAILFAALLSIVWLKMKPSAALQTFGSTLKDLALPIYSIGMVLAFAFISNYSGLSSTPALAPHTPAARLPSSRRSSAGWGIPDWIRHLIKRTVCRPAGHSRSANRRIRRTDGGGKYHRRRDRQDDLSTVHCYRLCGSRISRERV